MFTTVAWKKLICMCLGSLDSHTLVIMPFRALHACAFPTLRYLKPLTSTRALPPAVLRGGWSMGMLLYKWGPQFSLHSAWGPPCYCKVLCVVVYLSRRKNIIYFTSNRWQCNTEQKHNTDEAFMVFSIHTIVFSILHTSVQLVLRKVYSYDVCVCHLKRKYHLVDNIV